MYLKQFVLAADSPFIGQSIIDCGVRKTYHCLVVGVETGHDGNLHAPDVVAPLQKDDVLWVVGEAGNLKKLFDAGTAVTA